MAKTPLRLNQVIAVAKGAKADAERTVTTTYHLAQATPKLSGIARTYKPRDDEGEKLPPEGTRLQLRARDLIADLSNAFVRLFDVELTKDNGNQLAKSDIAVDGIVLAKDVPVTFLLTLEKKLVDLHTFVSKLPVLDPSEEWTWSTEHDAYITTSQSTRSKKVLRNHVKAPATDKHPAQVETYGEDTIVGDWTTIKLSGALPQSEVNVLRARVLKLQEAVKIARENANSTVAPDQEIGEKILGYVFTA
jgi:hypothetical protein